MKGYVYRHQYIKLQEKEALVCSKMKVLFDDHDVKMVLIT